MIDFSLTKEQEELRQEIIAFSHAHLNDDVEKRDLKEYFDRNLWLKCGDLKIQGLCVPVEYGGRGFDAVTTCIGLEALGFGSHDGGLNFSIAAHLLACCMPIVEYGTNDQKEKYLPKLCDGSYIATNAITESSSGSDAFVMESTAQENGEYFTLDGVKTFCSNGPVSDLAILYAANNREKGFFGGITCFILEYKEGHYERSPSRSKLGLRTTMMGEIECKNSQIHNAQILGKKGGGGVIFTRSMAWERICLGALHIGTIARLLGSATTFVNERLSGGKSISKYQSISHQLAEIQTELESSRLLMWKAAWELDQGKNLGFIAPASKLQTSEFFQRSMLKLKQVYAGYAFRGGNEIERNLRDSMGSTIYSGTSEVLKNMIARSIGVK